MQCSRGKLLRPLDYLYERTASCAVDSRPLLGEDHHCGTDSEWSLHTHQHVQRATFQGAQVQLQAVVEVTAERGGKAEGCEVEEA